MNESEFNQRLKVAVHSVNVPPHLEARIRSRIRADAPSRSWEFWPMPAGAAAAIAVGVLVVYQLGYLRLTATSQESYNVSVSARVATLMRVGLGDHIHCSVFRKYPKNAPPIEKLEGNLGPEYRGLIPIVKQNVPEDYRLMIGHQCRYHGRRFVHLSFKNDSHLLSLVIAKKGEGESFEAQGLLPALVQSGIPVYQSGVQRFAIDAFETHGFLVYFISDLPREQNAAMMIAMAPSVRQLLEKL
jgi:hypothetical protein